MATTQDSANLPVAAATDESSLAPEMEVRLAVVMYGGVSLAIYINGVAQELLRLVRATAVTPADSKTPSAPLLGHGELRGSERVYRKLGQFLEDRPDECNERGEPRQHEKVSAIPDSAPIRRRVVVDILSGTSAGGINGIYLAKALANQQSLDDVKRLWVTEAGIEKLINDKRPIEGLKDIKAQRPPESLLDSRRMYMKLLYAFEGMDAAQGGAPRPDPARGQASPFVDEMDLYVTATDIAGLPLPIRLADRAVCEPRHKSVFHFLYAPASATGDARNDFEKANNPMLAYAARCTSAFPFAFEPMTLADVALLPPYKGSPGLFEEHKETWKKKFFKDYTREAGACPARDTDDFVRRAFGDGGYLDNKPFSHATETLLRRRADVVVDRKLLYIEPSPEHPADGSAPAERPDAVRNVAAAVLTLPRKETIREDIERVTARNRLLARVGRILGSTQEDVGAFLAATHQGRAVGGNGNAWAKCGLKDMIKAHGPAYGAYHRLKVSLLTDELAELVCRVAGVEEDSDDLVAVRDLVRAWRDRNYAADPKPSDGKLIEGKQTENQFLLRFDLSYRLRRLNFILSMIDELYRLNGHSKDILSAVDAASAMPGTDDVSRRAARAELVAIKRELSPIAADLRAEGRHLRSRSKDSPLQALVEALPLKRDDLRALRTAPDERARMSMAEDMIKDDALAQAFQKLANALSTHAGEAFVRASQRCHEALDPAVRQHASDWRRCLWTYYERYEDYDLVRFPITTGTEAGEADEVEVLRVSPEDATTLVNQEKDGCHKLAGDAFAHFGAFLDKVWRQSDLLWGRLDGAERLIAALLPGHPEQRTLVLDATAEILAEELLDGLCSEQARRLVVEAFLHTEQEETGALALDRFAKAVCEATANAGLQKLLDPAALLEVHHRAWKANDHPSREGMVRVAARATTVVGRMFNGLADRYAKAGKRLATPLILVGGALWGMVEVAVPRSLWQLFYRYWLRLLYLMEGFLIVGGVLLGSTVVQQFGLVTLLITLSLDIAPRALAAWMYRRPLRPTLVWAGAFVLGVFLALGAFKAVELVGSLHQRLPWAQRPPASAPEVPRR